MSIEPIVLRRMREASYLLPDPGGSVARELIGEVTALQSRITELEGELAKARGEVADAVDTLRLMRNNGHVPKSIAKDFGKVIQTLLQIAAAPTEGQDNKV